MFLYPGLGISSLNFMVISNGIMEGVSTLQAYILISLVLLCDSDIYVRSLYDYPVPYFNLTLVTDLNSANRR